MINEFIIKLDSIFKEKLLEILDHSTISENIEDKGEILNFFEWIIVNYFIFFVYLK